MCGYSRLRSFAAWPWHCLIRGWVFRHFSNRNCFNWDCFLDKGSNHCCVGIVGIKLVLACWWSVIDHKVNNLITSTKDWIQILFTVWRFTLLLSCREARHFWNILCIRLHQSKGICWVLHTWSLCSQRRFISQPTRIHRLCWSYRLSSTRQSAAIERMSDWYTLMHAFWTGWDIMLRSDKLGIG